MRCSVGWSDQTGMRFRVNDVSGKLQWNKNKNLTYLPWSDIALCAFLAALHSSFICRFVHLPSVILASLSWRQLVCLLYKQATGYYTLQIGSGIKEQIQSAFKCTRIYHPIWKIIQASGAILIQRQWTRLINISKLDQLIISPKASLKSKLDTEGGFYLQLLRLFAFGDLLQLFKRLEQPTLQPPSNQLQLCDKHLFSNIFNQNSSWYFSSNLAWR